MLTVQRGAIDSFLSLDNVAGRFLDEHGDPAAQRGVGVHSSGSAELSGVTIAGMFEGCAVTVSATASLADCTVSDSTFDCVAVRGSSAAQLDNCTLTCDPGDCVRVRNEGSRVTATSCHLRGGRSGAVTADGGELTAHACASYGGCFGYDIIGGLMELLNVQVTMLAWASAFQAGI